MPASLKKTLAIVCLVSIIGIEVLVPIRASASFWTSAAGLVQGAGPVYEKFVFEPLSKEGVLDLIWRIVAAVLIRALTDQIVGWIQGDGGRNVGFIANMEQEFRRELDIRGGEFLNQLAGVNLCGNINAFLQISLRTSDSIRKRFACTVTDIVANVEDFFQDFSQGGWPAFIQLSLEPQNNPYGAFVLTYSAKARAQRAVEKALERNILPNQGYRGFQGITKKRCMEGPLPEGQSEKDRPCFNEYATKTPGGYIASTLEKHLNVGLDFAVVSDEVNEAATAIIVALIDKVISSSSGGGGGIYGTSGLRGLPATDEPEKDPEVLSGTLASGSVGQPYSTMLSAFGGTPPYTWSILGGELPPGLSLAPNGIISGTPTAAGAYQFTALARDKDGRTSAKTVTIVIGSIVAIVTTSMPDGTVGQLYSVGVSAIGGSGANFWSIVSGALPPGLSLDPGSGLVAGTPTTPGTFEFIISVDDVNGGTDEEFLSITVH